MKKPILVSLRVLGPVAAMALSTFPVCALAAPVDPAPARATDPGLTPPPPSPPVASPPVASPPVASPPVASPPVASPPVLSPAPPPEPPFEPGVVSLPQSDSSVKRRSVALVAAAVAVGAAGAGTVFGVLALRNKNDYDASPRYSNSDRGNNDAAYADGCIALAVAAGVTSLILYLTRDPRHLTRDPRHDADRTASGAGQRAAGLSASPLLLPPSAQGGVAGLLLRF
jgi:hypothetical protein